jgi:membrane protease YdiL (CAAX protease family)
MSADLTPTLVAAFILEMGLLLAGCVLLWRLAFSAAARARLQGPHPLPTWTISLQEFAIACLCVLLCALFVPMVLVHAGRLLAPSLAAQGDLWLVLQGGFLHIGLLTGVLAARQLTRHAVPPAAEEARPARYPRPLLAGVVTFIVSLPVITITALIWQKVMEVFGVEADPQALIDIFRNADSVGETLLIAGLAIVVAPITEELVFRAGLFRYLRTRVPRRAALIAPAILFASLHGSILAFAPLCVLGVIFALAYERTGRISVPIIAHALFNFNTIGLLLAGVTA